jgi:hypothetical protein
MEAVIWALTTLIGIFVLLGLLLGLVGVNAWLFRWVRRVWCGGVTDERRS